eukprot:c18280_g1_i2 orf=349-1878(-)
MALFKWLADLRQVYGTSLLFLVFLGYWVQGFRCFPWMAIVFYFKDVLHVDPVTLQFVLNTVSLPMVAKPIYGIFSDAVYIRGDHRLPYLVFGGFLQVLSWGAIIFLPGSSTSVIMISAFLALSNLGASIVEVANDALVAECGKRGKSAGDLQSFASFSSAAGGVVGNLIGAIALSRMQFKAMLSIFLLLLLAQVFNCFQVNEGSLCPRMLHIMCGETSEKDGTADSPKLSKERPRYICMKNDYGSQTVNHTVSQDIDAWEKELQQSETLMKTGIAPTQHANTKGILQQLTDLMQLVRQPEIAYPLVWFVASYAMIPTLSGMMFFYQTQHLKVNPMIVGSAKVLGQVGLMAGSVVYSNFLKGIPLRKLVGCTQIFLSFCILSDILLVRGVNLQFGIPNEMMVLGASAFVDGIGQFKILPFMVFLAQLCPSGSEGSLLAFFMSMQCLAIIISGYLGLTLASLLHISSTDFGELPFGILIQAIAALLPLLWMSFIPKQLKSPASQEGDGKQA